MWRTTIVCCVLPVSLLLVSCLEATAPTTTVTVVPVKEQLPLEQLQDPASVDGKYCDLLQTVYCPVDEGQYGKFYDYGYWEGTAWCDQTVQTGYWVYVAPNWHIWRRMR